MQPGEIYLANTSRNSRKRQIRRTLPADRLRNHRAQLGRPLIEPTENLQISHPGAARQLHPHQQLRCASYGFHGLHVNIAQHLIAALASQRQHQGPLHLPAKLQRLSIRSRIKPLAIRSVFTPQSTFKQISRRIQRAAFPSLISMTQGNSLTPRATTQKTLKGRN